MIGNPVSTISRENTGNQKITAPVFLIGIYIIFTFFPVIYNYLPFLGKIKIVLIIGIVLLITYLVSSKNPLNQEVYKSPIFISWAAFLLIMIIGLISSQDRGLTLKYIESNLKYFIVFFVMIRVIDNHKKIDLILGIFAACGVGMAVSAILNYFVFKETYQDSFRAKAMEGGIFGDPNDLAMFFIVVLPVLLYFFNRKKWRFAVGVGLVIVTTAIMLSYSRGGFIGLCVIGVGFLLMNRKKIMRYGFFLACIAVLFWILAPENYKERISTIKTETQINEETGKRGGRIEAWKSIIQEEIKHPLFGAGAGCSFYTVGQTINDWHSAHNSYVEVFVEMGLLGLCPFVLIFILPYKYYRNSNKLKIEEIKAHLIRYRFLLLSLAGFGATAFFLPQAYSPLLYFLSAMSLIQHQILVQEISPRKNYNYK